MIKKKNFIIFNGSSDINIFKIESVFSLNKLSLIFNNWNLKFFKLKRLGNYLKVLHLYSNSFFSYFLKLEELFLFFKFNIFLFKYNLKLLNICYNGFFLNLNYLNNLNYYLFSNIFLIYFFGLLLRIIFTLLYLFIYKLLYILNMSFLKKRYINSKVKFMVKNFSNNRYYCVSNKLNYTKTDENFLYIYVLFIFLFISLLFLLLFFKSDSVVLYQDIDTVQDVCTLAEVTLDKSNKLMVKGEFKGSEFKVSEYKNSVIDAKVSSTRVVFNLDEPKLLFDMSKVNQVPYSSFLHKVEVVESKSGFVDTAVELNGSDINGSDINDNSSNKKTIIIVAGTVLAGLIALAVWVWFCNKSSSAELPPPVVVEDAEELLFQENLARLWGNCEKDGVLKGHLYEIKDFSKYLSDINVDFKKISSDEIDEHFVKFLKEIKKKK